MIRLLFILFIVISTGCTEKAPLSENATPEEVAKYFTHTDFQVTHIPSTRYMALTHKPENIYLDGHLLDIKTLLPELLKRYPDVDRFAFLFEKEDMYFLKANFNRDQIKDVVWEQSFVGDLENYAESYWVIPTLRD